MNEISTSYTKILGIISEKHLQRPCNSTDTHWNSSNQDIFWFTPIILWESNNFTMLIFKIHVFIFYFISCCFQIYRLNILVISKVVFLLYLGFIWVCWTALASILVFCVPYLLNFLLLPFCNICYGSFLGWPTFFVPY